MPQHSTHAIAWQQHPYFLVLVHERMYQYEELHNTATAASSQCVRTWLHARDADMHSVLRRPCYSCPPPVGCRTAAPSAALGPAEHPRRTAGACYVTVSLACCHIDIFFCKVSLASATWVCGPAIRRVQHPACLEVMQRLVDVGAGADIHHQR